MNIKEILGKIGFQVDHAKLTRVEQQLEGIKSRLNFLGGIEIVKGLYHLAEQFSGVGEQVHVAALAAGLGTEEYQKLAYAANQSGVEQEMLSRSLVILAGHLYKAKTGSEEARAAFRHAGFTTEQIMGFKNSAQLMASLSDRLKNIQDPLKRVALAKELLGRASYKMAGFMALGGAEMIRRGEEGKKLGLILSENQIENLTKLEHAFKRLTGFIKAFSSGFIANIGPNFSWFIDDMLKFVGANKALIDLNMNTFFDHLFYSLGYAYAVIKYVATEILTWKTNWGEIAVLLGKGGAILTGLALLRNAWLLIAGAQALATVQLGAYAVLLATVYDIYAYFAGKKQILPQLTTMLGLRDAPDGPQSIPQAMGNFGRWGVAGASTVGGDTFFNVEINGHSGNAEDIKNSVRKVLNDFHDEQNRKLDRMHPEPQAKGSRNGPG